MKDFQSLVEETKVLVQKEIENKDNRPDYILEKHEDIRLIHIGVPDVYVEHGGVDQLKKTLHMDADSIVERICMEMDGE